MANQLKVTVRNAPLNNTNFGQGNGISADFNNDGYADIIFATDISSSIQTQLSPVAIFTYNKTTQSFDPFKITIDGVSNIWPEVYFGMYIAVSDINKDGITDFIIIDQNELPASPNTFGPFTGAYQYAYISTSIGNYNKVDLGIGIANVHGYAIIKSIDGKFRIAANTPWTGSNPSNFSISTYNDTTGLFESSLFSNGDSFYSSAGVPESEYFFTTGIDVNNDGNTDLIGFTSPGNISAIYLNNGFGGFAFSKTIDMSLKGRFASEGGWGIGEVVEEVSIGDFNNDGYDDFVVLAIDRRGWPNQTEFKTIRVLINDQYGSFVDQTTTWKSDRFQNADLSYGYIDTMDINNDGKSDLIWNHMTTKSWIPNVSHHVIDVMLSTGSAFEVFTLGSEISSPSWDKSKSSIGARVIPISDNQVVMSTDWSKSFNSITTFSYENLIEGTPQNDLLLNLSGNDQIDGGEGVDTLVVSGLPSQ